jgi:hypothetical protein
LQQTLSAGHPAIVIATHQLSLTRPTDRSRQALFHAALDVFISSPVSQYLPNVMGALITIGALAMVPMFGSENLARRSRVTRLDRFAERAVTARLYWKSP